MIAGWLLVTALCAVICFVFVAMPIGKRFRLALWQIVAIALVMGGVWSYLIIASPGTYDSDEDCIEHTPQGSGRC